MAENTKRKAGTPGAFSRWMQHRMNARMARKLRKGKGEFMGMDVLLLSTKGRQSGQQRETPLAWFADGEDSRLIVASGGGSQNPDWYVNLMAHPEEASIELPNGETLPVKPVTLEGDEWEEGWHRIATAQPRIAKYQSKSDRKYPVVRLTSR